MLESKSDLNIALDGVLNAVSVYLFCLKYWLLGFYGLILLCFKTVKTINVL